MATAKDISGGAEFTVRIGQRVHGALRPGETFGHGVVPSEREAFNTPSRHGDHYLTLDDLEPGAVLWVVDPRSRGDNGDERAPYTAWPAVVQGDHDEWRSRVRRALLKSRDVVALKARGLYDDCTPRELVALDKALETM